MAGGWFLPPPTTLENKILRKIPINFILKTATVAKKMLHYVFQVVISFFAFF